MVQDKIGIVCDAYIRVGIVCDAYFRVNLGITLFFCPIFPPFVEPVYICIFYVTCAKHRWQFWFVLSEE